MTPQPSSPKQEVKREILEVESELPEFHDSTHAANQQFLRPIPRPDMEMTVGNESTTDLEDYRHWTKPFIQKLNVPGTTPFIKGKRSLNNISWIQQSEELTIPQYIAGVPPPVRHPLNPVHPSSDTIPSPRKSNNGFSSPSSSEHPSLRLVEDNAPPHLGVGPQPQDPTPTAPPLQIARRAGSGSAEFPVGRYILQKARTTKSFPPDLRTVGESILPGVGLRRIYKDGSHVKKVIGGEAVNELLGLTKIGRARKRLRVSCMPCQAKKIRCDKGEPKCTTCENQGRECYFETA